MKLLRKIRDKLLPPGHHHGVIEWQEPEDAPPPLASRPAPLEPSQDEDLWAEWIELDSRPAPLGKETP